ncbi:MAG: hypothetical protein NC930_05410, partial [Candidatus Omnitrophica bacterium]|nr:hypothetical protein [Candidatus Omnitrophota bacterium]
KEGGVLDVILHEIEVECLPTQIPEKFEIDVKEMKIGDIIQIKDLSVPNEVTLKMAPDDVVVSLHPPEKVEEVAPAAVEEATAPEVIEKGKKEVAGAEEVQEAKETKKESPPKGS